MLGATRSEMKIFINDTPVNILKVGPAIQDKLYDVVETGPEIKISNKKLWGTVLVKDAKQEQIDRLLHLMTFKKFKNLKEITFAFEKPRPMIDYVKGHFKIVEAAGGVVENGSKLLFIYRFGKWDLPKGKLDKKETLEACAKREVEEECNIRIEIGPRICKTWHTYILNGKYILKKTHWFLMFPLDISKLAPQVEEHIEEIKWMNDDEVAIALYNSYSTIEYVIQKYRKFKSLGL